MHSVRRTAISAAPRDLAAVLQIAQQLPQARLAVVAADDDAALHAVAGAVETGLVKPVLFGNEAAIRGRLALHGKDDKASAAVLEVAEFVDCTHAAETAVTAAGDGSVDILLKGGLRTDQLLRAVLGPDSELKTGRLLSDVLLYEDRVSGRVRLVAITDGGIAIAPTLEQKREIVANAAGFLRRLGFARPRIAIMSATEVVIKAMPSTLDAEQLTLEGERGDFGQCDVDGPLALDNALLPSAAEAKGITGPVAGRADCLVAPTIEAGNLLGKSAKFFTGSSCGHVIVGAAVPVLIPSRVESAADKLVSIALGVIAHDRG